MHGRTVVITGANSGIGLETAVALAAAGARVVMGCRDPGRADAAVAEVRERTGSELVEQRHLDLADLTSVEAFAAGLSDLDRVDVLVNNAGLIQDRLARSAQGHEMTVAVNHLGHFLLTERLLDRVREAPAGRVVVVASVAHVFALRGVRLEGPERRDRYNGWAVYAESKLANILHARELARRLRGSGTVVHSLHPGNVTTGFGHDGDMHGANRLLMEASRHILITPEQGARTSVHVASSPEALRTTGDYWVRRRRSRPAPWARDDEAAAALWRTSAELVGL